MDNVTNEETKKKSSENMTSQKKAEEGLNTPKASEKSTSSKASEKSSKKNSGKKKKTALSYALEFFIKIFVTAVIASLLLIFVTGVYVNHSNSSYPMIKDGDLCITYKLSKPVLGDEIAYESGGKIRFGRIVARSGDIVDISDGNITVNGYGVYEDTVYPTPAEGSSIEYPYTVPTDKLFILNDYREDITDSRTYGAIPVSDSKGKIILLLRRRGI